LCARAVNNPDQPAALAMITELLQDTEVDVAFSLSDNALRERSYEFFHTMSTKHDAFRNRVYELLINVYRSPVRMNANKELSVAIVSCATICLSNIKTLQRLLGNISVAEWEELVRVMLLMKGILECRGDRKSVTCFVHIVNHPRGSADAITRLVQNNLITYPDDKGGTLVVDLLNLRQERVLIDSLFVCPLNKIDLVRAEELTSMQTGAALSPKWKFAQCKRALLCHNKEALCESCDASVVALDNDNDEREGVTLCNFLLQSERERDDESSAGDMMKVLLDRGCSIDRFYTHKMRFAKVRKECFVVVLLLLLLLLTSFPPDIQHDSCRHARHSRNVARIHETPMFVVCVVRACVLRRIAIEASNNGCNDGISLIFEGQDEVRFLF
jgi:hypothetical protein